MGNTNSLPHESKGNGYHLDHYSYVEGQEKIQKFHLPIIGPKVPTTSIEALRQRLGNQKG